MTKQRIFVYEYLSGGGLVAGDDELLDQGARCAMPSQRILRASTVWNHLREWRAFTHRTGLARA